MCKPKCYKCFFVVLGSHNVVLYMKNLSWMESLFQIEIESNKLIMQKKKTWMFLQMLD